MDNDTGFENIMLNGELFNQMYCGTRLVKVVTSDQDGTIQIGEGLNIRNFTQCATHAYAHGAIEIQSFGLQMLKKIKSFYSNLPIYVYDVKIPNDAEFLVRTDYFMSNKVLLSNKRNIDNLEEWGNEEFCDIAINVGGECLKYILNMNQDLILKLLEKDWSSIKYINDPTDEMSKLALRKSPYAFYHIKNPSQEICVEAVKASGENFKSVPDDKRSYEVYLALVGHKPECIKETPSFFKTEELLTIAVSKFGYTIKDIEQHLLTETMCVVAINSLTNDFQVENIIKHIGSNNMTPVICIAFVSRFPISLKYIPVHMITEDLCVEAVRQSPYIITSIPDRNLITYRVWMEVVKKNGLLLEKIDVSMQDEELCLVAVSNNGLALQYVKIDKTQRICKAAYENNVHCIKFIPDVSETMYNDAVTKDHLILKNMSNLHNLSDETIISIIKKSPEFVLQVPDCTQEMILEAVKRNGDLIEKLDKKYLTHEIYLEAVRDKPFALRFIQKENQTVDICIMAVKQNGFSIQHVKIYDESVCFTAIKQNPGSIIQIKTLNEKMCIEAIKLKPTTIHLVPAVLKTPKLYYELLKVSPGMMNQLIRDLGNTTIDWPIELHEELVNINGLLIKYIKDPTEKICKLAILNKPYAIQYLNDNQQTEELCELAVKLQPLTLAHIKNQTSELCLQAINKNYLAFSGVNTQDKLFCIHASIINPKIIGCIKNNITKQECEKFIDNILVENM